MVMTKGVDDERKLARQCIVPNLNSRVYFCVMVRVRYMQGTGKVENCYKCLVVDSFTF